jgi:hypothetical protein
MKSRPNTSDESLVVRLLDDVRAVVHELEQGASSARRPFGICTGLNLAAAQLRQTVQTWERILEAKGDLHG